MLNIREVWLKDKGIEFIVSTVGIDECSVPVVIVNTLLFQEDKVRIEKLIDQIKTISPNQPLNRKKTLNLKEKMVDLNSYSNAITEIIDNFLFLDNSQAEDINELITDISNMVCQNDVDREQLRKDLVDREEKGGTYISEYRILLLHCLTKTIKQIHFGIVKINKEILCTGSSKEKERAELGVVILVPENSNKYLLETISFVSGMFVERPDFIKALKDGSKEEAFYELCSILEEYYNQKGNRYLKNSI